MSEPRRPAAVPPRTRWPRGAVATCSVLAAAVVVLGAVLGVEVAGSSGGGTAATAAAGDPAGAPRTGRVSSADVSASAMPAATVDAEQAMVGPLFPDGTSHDHSCTGTVVASSRGDTVLTAAHCLSGTARGWSFVPGYDRGRAPDGVWTVTGQYLTDRWRQGTAASDDFAVLTVADRTVDGRRTTLASVTGAAQIGTTPSAGTVVRVIGYNSGRDDTATTCAVPVRVRHDHPTFYCHGFVGGSSGSPWLLADAGAPTLVGVIGGRHQGGCTEYTSHSSPFTSAVTALVARASRGDTPDTAPSAGGDNCPSASG